MCIAQKETALVSNRHGGFIRQGGFTLVEAMVAMAVLAIASLGALSYQYHTARHAQIAKFEMTATRTAQLLLEDWKSVGGLDNYDPTDLNVGFYTDPEIDGFYRINVDGLPMYVRLRYEDIDHDDVAGVTLREISVIVRWSPDYEDGQGPQASDPHLVLTTYVRLDA